MLSFFSFGWGDFLFFMFSMCSHQVFKVFPKFPMPLKHSQQHFTFNPILFGCGSTCKEVGGMGGKHIQPFMLESSEKYWWWVNQMVPSGKQKKRLWVHQSLMISTLIMAQSYHPWEYFWDFFITSIYHNSRVKPQGGGIPKISGSPG